MHGGKGSGMGLKHHSFFKEEKLKGLLAQQFIVLDRLLVVELVDISNYKCSKLACSLHVCRCRRSNFARKLRPLRQTI